jgi:hypothetical protein
MAKGYSISKETWIWTEKISFYLLELSILNCYIFSRSCGVNREQLITNLVVLLREESTEIRGVPRGRPSSLETQMTQLKNLL